MKKLFPLLILSSLLDFGKGERFDLKVYPVHMKRVNNQLSKRAIQKMKGKKNRKNRGRLR